ncbi:MAG: TIGR00730 family Rossman fold protein [Bacteroidales bacterium]|nr:TIGR00730 family Rossman fold protein [Bacteroidales bacterium]
MNVVIFCSASKAAAAHFNECAAFVTEGLCTKGYGIVSGGTTLGTMKVVADTVVRCGGFHKGVLPRFMEPCAYPSLSETVWTDTMSQRKESMREGTVAAIALPGGIGTLDELIETHVLKKLRQYEGRVVVLNLDGFFNPFLDLLDHYVSTGMLNPQDKALVEVFDTPEALLASF